MSNKHDVIRQYILNNVEKHPADITVTVASEFNMSRQAAHKHVAKLVKEGLLTAEGATRNRIYKPKPLVELNVEMPLENLEEDKIWRLEVQPHLKGLSENVFSICHYGFTEMVNNVIDHSGGTALKIVVRQTYRSLSMCVQDDGIGIFRKIVQAFNLDDPLHAILELSKGKLTSDPARHSGEGIFFSSRVFDRFYILSEHLSYAHLGVDGYLVEDEAEFVQGTIIKMEIDPLSERTTRQVFDAYSDEDDYSFTKTIVPVFLAAYGDENLVSRSQAKRLLARFEKFKDIRLDFAKVEIIGQAFADEIFRVFMSKNPEIKITPVNTSEQIEKMISHVVNSNI